MLVRYLALFLEWIFFIGLAGSLVVAVLAFVGDLHVFFGKDEEAARIRSEEPYASPSAAAND